MSDSPSTLRASALALAVSQAKMASRKAHEPGYHKLLIWADGSANWWKFCHISETGVTTDNKGRMLPIAALHYAIMVGGGAGKCCCGNCGHAAPDVIEDYAKTIAKGVAAIPVGYFDDEKGTAQ